MLRGRAWARGVVLLAIGMLAAGALSLSPATAGKFLTKKKANKLFLTPAEGDSMFITPAEGDASYLPATGELRLNASPMTWQKTNAAATQVSPAEQSIGSTTFGGSTSAVQDVPFSISPTLPTVLSGRSLELVGVNACYVTDSTTIDNAQIHVTNNGNTSMLLDDPTNRSDDDCMSATLGTPRPIAATEDVTFGFIVDYSSNGQSFSAGRATFIFNIV